MKFTKQQEKLLEFVKEKHGKQKRKYTEEPYWEHPLEVANIVCKFVDSDFVKKYCLVEISLCHDLFEDTDCNFSELERFLLSIRYNKTDSRFISFSVGELTDKYTSDKYPNINRKRRKHLEAERLRKTSFYSQIVKCADLLHNTDSIVTHDPNFAKVYLKEKIHILNIMKVKDLRIYHICRGVTKKLINELSNNKK